MIYLQIFAEGVRYCWDEKSGAEQVRFVTPAQVWKATRSNKLGWISSLAWRKVETIKTCSILHCCSEAAQTKPEGMVGVEGFWVFRCGPRLPPTGPGETCSVR